MAHAPLFTPRGFSDAEWRDACGEATALLQRLIRVDTSNPPGQELAAAQALDEELRRDGLQPELLESQPGRANLVCRLPAAPGSTPGLLLASHLDVVPAGEVARWTHPPFSGELAEGMIWGRGAVDMKNMVAMSAMVMKLLARRGVALRRDLVLAAVADEEAGCTHGSRFLVEQHPEKVAAQCGLGEVGGFPMKVGRARFMFVETAERGICWLKLTARGPGGHGSLPRPDSAPLRLAEALTRLGSARLPRHLTPVAEAFVQALAAPQALPMRRLLPLLAKPGIGDFLIDHLPDRAQARTFHALFHNTVSPTVLRAGSATNVIPDSATVELDGRLLPGQSADDLIRELRDLLGEELELSLLRTHPAMINHPPESPLWRCIARTLGERAPDLHLTPYMLPGYSDAAYFSRLGIRWYGFAPVWLDPDSRLRFWDLFHGIDERIPEDGLHWGLGMLYDVVHAFCAGE